jgi:hypothetical protein
MNSLPEAADHEGELLENGLPHRKQPEFGDVRRGGHALPLGDFVCGIDVIQALVAVLIALMHGVDAQVSR